MLDGFIPPGIFGKQLPHLLNDGNFFFPRERR